MSKYRWYTTEEPPRRINVLGKSAIDPDVTVAEALDGGRAWWILDNGSKGHGPFTILADPSVTYKAFRIEDATP